MNSSPVIVAQQLTRRFGTFTAVDHIQLSVPRAQIYGFLGPNGSGKSTTIRMLCGLLLPSEGEVQVLGLSIPRQAEQLKLKIGYMTQKFSLYDDLSVEENLEFIAQVYCLTKPQQRRRIDQLLLQYHLAERRKQRAATLSGGQRQRLALAAATLHEPELLFLDEPTSAVDPQSRREFWETLFTLTTQGTTILVSTHYMDEAERCHRLAILDRGKIVADGSPRELEERIAAKVVEIESEQPQATRQHLLQQRGVLSVTQLGVRLRILIQQQILDPVQHVRGLLPVQTTSDTITQVRPNLEDVFVAATQGRYREGQ
ncbi:MAG: ABC transporter ATP-binding protein [Gammaproteobacteria bacterium]|nr:ABC transporter ATP-binding protein [Gammaproteobacteria bacterium]